MSAVDNRSNGLRKTACRRLRPFRYLRIPPQDRERLHLVRERVKCGKPFCHCARGLKHGPYIFLGYQYWDAVAGRDPCGQRRRGTHAASIRRHLRLSGERRNHEADNENDREPEQSHGHLVEDGWRGV
jgi:hypothetical protein